LVKLAIFTSSFTGELLLEGLLNKSIFPKIVTYKADFLRTSLSRDFSIFESFFEITYLNSNKYEDNKEILKKLNFDTALCIEWTKDFFANSVPPFNVYHTHPALLPFYRGYGAITEQFIQGVVKSGLTIYENSIKIDGGNIVYQETINIDFNDYPEDFIKKYTSKIINFIEKMLSGELNLDTIKQNEDLSFYLVRKRNKNAIIDFNRDAYSIYNHIRGYSHPFFGAHFYFKDKKIKVFKSEIRAWQGYYGEPGVILEVKEDYIDVACGTGMIRLNKLKQDEKSLENLDNIFEVNSKLNY
jgi:methionyl-tRNA formyltransferase